MEAPAIVAVDPGSRHTGVVCRWRDQLVGWRLLTRPGGSDTPDGPWLRELVTEVRTVGEEADRPYIVAVERVAWWPGSHRNQTHLYGTAMVVGALLVRWPEAVMVDSGRGAAKLHPLFYPAPIRPKKLGSKGTDKLSHVRAAWDHSHAAETEWLVERRTKPEGR